MTDTDFFSIRDPYEGQVFGGEFKIERQIGVGGMGTVYRALQTMTERPVALKILHRHLLSEVVVKRFQQEARIISKLSHPNIVTIFKYGQHEDGALYIAMEFAEGRDLTRLIQSKAMFDPRRSVPLMVQMADAVAYAHDLKIIHRDLKPENMVIARTGREERVKILDFGIAKIIDTKYIVTKTGMLCGSPPYMAPEQWRQARDLDGRTDIYALGCVFYAMVTGRLPFEADTTPGFMNLHLAGAPVPPIERSASLEAAPALNDVILRAMAPDRADRYPDAYALKEALSEIELALRTGSTANGTNPAPEERLEPTTTTNPAVPSLPDRVVPVGPRAVDPAADTVPPPEPGVEATASNGGDSSSRPLRSCTLADTPADPAEDRNGATSSNGNVPSLQWTRSTLMNAGERARAQRSHQVFVIAGILMLVFLALSFVYFVWIDERPTAVMADLAPVVIEPLESGGVKRRSSARARSAGRGRAHRRRERGSR